MSGTGFALFETPIGTCGIAWGPKGLRAVSLPGGNPAAMRAALRRRSGGEESAPPPEIAAVIRDILALLGGSRVGFENVRLEDEDLPELEARVYALARAIPPGQTRTYGEIAAELGDPALARDVGKALARNRWPIVVPCHRVLAAGGRAGGFSAPGGVATKFRILEIEGALAESPPLPFDDLPWAAAPRRD